MKITSTEEYGLRCLVRVGRQADTGPVSAQDVADSEGLSLPYAQKLLRALTRGGLLRSSKGAHGGYQLARDAREISLGDAIRVLGGVIELDSICTRHTGEQSVCCHNDDCTLRPVWGYVSEFIVRTFDSIPLALLLDNEHVVARALMSLVPDPVEVPVPDVSPPVELMCPIEGVMHSS